MTNPTNAAANSRDVVPYLSAPPESLVNTVTWVAAGDPAPDEDDDENEDDEFDDDDEEDEGEEDEEGDKDSDEEAG
jgi:hypothetical protein